MKRENIETIIRDLFRDNYRSYPEKYVGEEWQQNAVVVAELYWHNRTDDEIDRDEQSGVTKEDYIKWCLAELKERTVDEG